MNNFKNIFFYFSTKFVGNHVTYLQQNWNFKQMNQNVRY